MIIVLNFSIFFWDFYSGTNTQGFGVLEPYYGIGMFYVYMISYFSSLIVIYAILRSKHSVWDFSYGFYMLVILVGTLIFWKFYPLTQEKVLENKVKLKEVGF